jgi:CRISPR-associated protein (TIGR02584 family)
MSPAVLTETVWALAHETPPRIPDRVIVITTIAGRQAIERELSLRRIPPEAVRAVLAKKPPRPGLK